jgi:hypothetical protein
MRLIGIAALAPTGAPASLPRGGSLLSAARHPAAQPGTGWPRSPTIQVGNGLPLPRGARGGGEAGRRPSWRVRRGSAGGGLLRFGMAQIFSTDEGGKFTSMALPVHLSRSPKLDRRPRRCVPHMPWPRRGVICCQCRAEPCIKTHARPALARHRGQLTAARCPRSSGAASRWMIQHSLLRRFACAS